ncbi:MAG: zinc metalloprotease HtpX [Atribacterota bacterium]
MNNNIKTSVLLALLTALFLVVGNLLGGKSGLIIAGVVAVIINFTSYLYSDKIVLKMYKARPMDEKEYPQIYKIVHNLCAAANIPSPRIFIIPQSTPNAFATGKNKENSVIAFTRGMIEGMDRNQLKGVIAHEISHIKHNDMLISTVVATIAGAIGFIATMARWALIFGGGRDDEEGGLIGVLVASIVAPLAALLIQAAVSRQREYEADREGGIISGNPQFLIDALKNLSFYNKKQPMRKKNPSTAHLFIVNPFSLKGINRLFSTHPPVEERIKRLQSIKNW